ncbi:DNA-directed RNA polymerase subunit alpha [Candidatus Nomurabacteria bacterium]|nr:DNA-directed RNA polymerase subunit alpha [Candidatus Nomurabacteria bacterium]USN94955.1 MAG: DNA-directed RNA polymerase subunit alpha [Candidatus Nomurabacteria bacterium]
MLESIILPTKPKIIKEDQTSGVFEIENLYPGYGHTLGNSLRRIILSSLTGSSITSIKIDGVDHEFSTMDGVKEDVVTLILALRKVRFKLLTDEPQVVTLKATGAKTVTAKDIETTGQVEVLNPEIEICEITEKGKVLNIEIKVQKGIGFVSKDQLQKEKVEIGTIAVDAIFTPIRRASYEVEDMRVGDKTNYNRLRIKIETDGSISPKEVLEKSIEIMIRQLQAVIGFDSAVQSILEAKEDKNVEEETPESEEDMTDVMKTRVESLDLPQRVINALTNSGIRTIGGLIRKKEADLLEVEGLGDKGVQDIKDVLKSYGASLE